MITLVCFLAIFEVYAVVTESECEVALPGHVVKALGDYCYFLHPDEKRMQYWTGAECYCQSKGGHLTSIHNQVEIELIQSLGEAQGLEGAWIGLHDETDGLYTWTDGSPVDYLNWSKDQPSEENDNNIVLMFLENSPSDTFYNRKGKWADWKEGTCYSENIHISAICKMPLNVSSIPQYDTSKEKDYSGEAKCNLDDSCVLAAIITLIITISQSVIGTFIGICCGICCEMCIMFYVCGISFTEALVGFYFALVVFIEKIPNWDEKDEEELRKEVTVIVFGCIFLTFCCLCILPSMIVLSLLGDDITSLIKFFVIPVLLGMILCQVFVFVKIYYEEEDGKKSKMEGREDIDEPVRETLDSSDEDESSNDSNNIDDQSDSEDEKDQEVQEIGQTETAKDFDESGSAEELSDPSSSYDESESSEFEED